MKDSLENFERYLQVKGLSEKTIGYYGSEYKHFQNAISQYGFNQITIDAFLIAKHNSSLIRAFMRNYLEFLDNRDFKIPRITGKKKKNKIDHISEEEVYRVVDYLFNHALDERFALMVLLAYHCGLRREEVVKVRISDFDLIGWQQEPDKPVKLKIHGKFSKERYVIVPVGLMKIIKDFMLKRVEQIKSEDELLFKRSGSRMTEKFREACRNSLGRSYKFHGLRHSRSLEWYKEGKDLLQIKNRLGHSSIATTQLYINPEEEQELDKWREEC